MANFNFAEAYRSSGLVADAETIKVRQPAFESIAKLIKGNGKSLELARLYFGLPVQDIEWFREPFASADNSFSMNGNANEVAALAACLLEATGDELGTLAALSISAFGARAPVVRPEMLARLSYSNGQKQINYRKDIPTSPEKIRVSGKEDAVAAIEVFAQGQELSQAVDAFRKLNSDSQSAGRSLAEQTKTFATALSDQMDVLNEKVELLWWHIGGWSSITNSPFVEMDVGSASILAGLDMCSLSSTYNGPVGMPALLYRTIWQGREINNDELSFADAIASLRDQGINLINVSEAARKYPEIYPVHVAIQKAKEIEGADAWYSTFEKVTGLSHDIKFRPSDLAVQVFREATLLEAIDGWTS